MARGGRRSAFRTVQSFRAARKQYRARPSKRGLFSAGRKFGGSLLDNVAMSLGKGTLYGGAASKIIPGIAPLATLYGEYSGGGIEALAINEILVKPFLGIPSVLPNILGNLGNLGGLFGGNPQPGTMSPGMMQAV